jgi:Fur family ferric uptake transcriptional regulator
MDLDAWRLVFVKGRFASSLSDLSALPAGITVRLLEEKGILERRDFGGGRARYEPTEHGHHYHLIDIGTGKVIEFEDAEHRELMRRIAARLGFELVSLRLELFGRKLEVARERPASANRETEAQHEAPGPAAR